MSSAKGQNLQWPGAHYTAAGWMHNDSSSPMNEKPQPVLCRNVFCLTLLPCDDNFSVDYLTLYIWRLYWQCCQAVLHPLFTYIRSESLLPCVQGNASSASSVEMGMLCSIAQAGDELV